MQFILYPRYQLEIRVLTFLRPDPGGRRGLEAPRGCLFCWDDEVWPYRGQWRPLKGPVHSENIQYKKAGVSCQPCEIG